MKRKATIWGGIILVLMAMIFGLVHSKQNIGEHLGLAETYSGKENEEGDQEILQKSYELTYDARVEMLNNEAEVLEKETAILSEEPEKDDDRKILIKEFAEAPTIIGRPWKDVTIQDFYDYYGLSEVNSLIKLDDNWLVYYNHETQARMAFFAEESEVDFCIDQLQKKNQYTFSKNLITSGVDFSNMEGYSEYVIKKDIDSLEDLLTVWEVDKVSEEFIQFLKEIRMGENVNAYKQLEFQSDYGEVHLSLQDAGAEIRLYVYLKNENTWAERIEITEDEKEIAFLYWFR